MSGKLKLTGPMLLAVVAVAVVRFTVSVSGQSSQTANGLQPKALVAEMARLTSDGRLIADWPLTQALMNLPESLRRQLALSDAELAEAASLTRDTANERRKVRLKVASSLGLAEDTATVEALTGALRSSAVEQRRYAAFGLWLVGDGASLAPLLGALSEADAGVRRFALLAVGRILEFRHIKNESAINTLLTALRHESEPMRREAARALAHAGRPAHRAVPALIELYQTDRSEYVRQQAVHGLGHLGEDSAAAAETLLNALSDSSGEVRRYAAHGLSDIEHRLALRAVPTLVNLLQQDRWEEVRREAAHALGHLAVSSQAAIEALTRAARNDPAAAVRRAAAQALADLAHVRSSGQGDDGRKNKED
ncbi:MAG: HEAT repeat domain-containing protein [Blastocatellia bacterium]